MSFISTFNTFYFVNVHKLPQNLSEPKDNVDILGTTKQLISKGKVRK